MGGRRAVLGARGTTDRRTLARCGHGERQTPARVITTEGVGLPAVCDVTTVVRRESRKRFRGIESPSGHSSADVRARGVARRSNACANGGCVHRIGLRSDGVCLQQTAARLLRRASRALPRGRDRLSAAEPLRGVPPIIHGGSRLRRRPGRRRRRGCRPLRVVRLFLGLRGRLAAGRWTNRLTALVGGGWPPLGGQYRETLAASESRGARGETANYTIFYRSLRAWPERDAVASLQCPRMVFVGTEDKFVAEGRTIRHAALIREHREDLERLGWAVRFVDGFGHELGGRPDVVIPLVREFLDPLLLSRAEDSRGPYRQAGGRKRSRGFRPWGSFANNRSGAKSFGGTSDGKVFA